METVNRRQLLPGVWLTAIRTKKFKTGYFGLHLLAPLREETAAPNALLPLVLFQGTRRCPDQQAISGLLDELYGGAVEPSIRKRGETQCIGFVGSFLDDAYTQGSAISARAIALLGDLLLRPNTRNGRFRNEYVDLEKENLRAMIASQVNDKRFYATQRLVEEMSDGEAFGVSRLGKAETLDKLNNLKLFQLWQRMILTCPIELYYCGSSPLNQIEGAWKEALIGLPRQDDYPYPDEVRQTAPQEAKTVTERLDVTQAKLTMGFRTGCTLADQGYPALLVMNALFGGSPNSRLFLSVREKLSLCYYASSQLDKHAGLMLVSSGVEFGNLEQAKEEILAQLEAIRRGEFSPEELDASKRHVINSLSAANDSQGQLESFLFSQVITGPDIGPSELALLVEDVSAGQVAEAAQAAKLDTVYILLGPESEAAKEVDAQ